MSPVNNLMSLKGRQALITGATGGLGVVIVETLAELGADLLLVDQPGSDFSGLLEKVKRWPIKVETLITNLEFEDSRKSLIDDIKMGGHGLSILVNNAAFVGASNLTGWSAPFEEQSLDTWRRALEVNLTAIFHICQGLAPVIEKSVGGNIINLASIYGILGPDWGLYADTNMSNPAAYAASKGGLIQLTRWLSTTLAPAIRVNSISPGGIWREQEKAFVKRYELRTPLGRMATESDFIGPIAFLATDLAQYVTGQNLVVDGGWSSW